VSGRRCSAGCGRPRCAKPNGAGYRQTCGDAQCMASRIARRTVPAPREPERVRVGTARLVTTIGRQLCAEAGLPYPEGFRANTLHADLLRFKARRQLRAALPDSTPELREQLIGECL
jgi:hypothetical protein